MILDKVPDTFVAGDTWRFTRSFGDYPAPTWVVTYYFENATGSFSSLAVASGASQAVTIASATTAVILPGKYKWFARAVSAGITETIPKEEGWLTVEPDIAATGTRDHRSDARKMLDAINATLLGRATDDQLAMAINGRSIQRTPLPELVAFRAQLRTEVRTEESASSSSRYIRVRLGRG